MSDSITEAWMTEDPSFFEKGLKSAYSEDGVHPNIAGYKVMEPLVEEAISDSSNK